MPRSWPLVAACAGSLVLAAPAAVLAQVDSARIFAERFEASLKYQTGTISLKDGLATLAMPSGWRFLDPAGARRLLVDAWGNPKDVADGVLGVLVPADISPISDSGWAVIIEYMEDGYVDDKGAESINYTELLQQMQTAIQQANEERKKNGYESMTLVGWAEAPSYDSATHKLYWAKELKFGDAKPHTLNYSIRVLGRKGVLVLNAVAKMTDLAMIKSSMPAVIAFVGFNEGHRYGDHVSGDKVAEYGIAGLVAGTLAAKAGFFKLLLAGLLAAKKAIIVVLLAASAWFKRMWARIRGKEAVQPGPGQP